ncbi:DUF2690 domain-containing protein [Microcoleus sp. bin38.metabat.b11b12b14.051]|uniref:DUF2690 domain-containing protein n=1 Tax=Microcoleus sp. bin38.metabat.b11b12b14.051 TaxID=2742709 RepID=UPI0025FF5D3C|nr:DUF2690 domain-containing protein [Microcoleus sp. bin38.metabat.b11b12b14.051]
MNSLKFLVSPLLILLAPLIFWDLSISIYDIMQPPICHGISCINQDARNAKCDADVQTRLEQKIGNITLKLRYSALCHASWASAIVPPYSILYVKDKEGKEYGRYETENDGIAGVHYGNMGPGKKLSACVRLPQDSQPKCTTLAE